MKFFLMLACLAPIFSFASTHTQTLAQKGYPNGLISREGKSTASVYVRLPSPGRITSANLKLELESSPLLKSPSMVKIFFFFFLLTQIPLTGSAGSEFVKTSLSLPLPRTSLAAKYGRFDFQFVNIVSGDPCLDQRLGEGLVRVTERTALELSLDDSDLTVGDFFLTLPQVVRVSVPADRSPGTMKLLLQLIAIVQSSGGRVEFVTSPDDAEIVLTETGSDIELRTLNGTPRLMVPLKASFAAAPFLGDIGGLFQTTVMPSVTLAEDAPRTWLARNELGLSATGEPTTSGRSWAVNLPKLSGRNETPTKLHLSLTTAPSFGQRPAALYVYLGEELLRVISLLDSELPQYHQVLLPERLPEWPTTLRLEVRRNDLAGKCGQDYGRNFDLRLLEDSALEYAAPTEKAADFVGFARVDTDLEVILPKTSGTDLRWLHQLAWLRKSFDLNVDRMHFTTTEGSASRRIRLVQPKSTDPVVLRFLASRKLSVSSLRKITLVTAGLEGETPTLTVEALGGPFVTRAPSFSPDHHDLLAFGAERVEALGATRELRERVARHGQGPSLITFLEEWRYLLLGLAWVALTLAFLALGKKFK